MDTNVRDSRGRDATRPGEIPRRGWKDILRRLKNQIDEDNLYLVAAGVAFYLFLALFPAIAALVSILGLIMQPADVERFVAAAADLLPPDALAIIQNQVHEMAATSGRALGLGLAISVAVALWSATAGMKALMTALNIAYEEREKRGLLGYYGTALVLTLSAIAFVVIALALVAALPVVLEWLALPPFIAAILGFVRWLVLAGAFLVVLAALYRYAPSRKQPQWRWVSWGAVVATLLWLAGSALFSLYVSNFGDYNATYGAIAAVAILMMWFYLTAFAILLGAELNAEIEHQTEYDSTVGEPKPMGRRGAQMADTLGEGQ